MFLYRPHRGGLRESMLECIAVKDWEELSRIVAPAELVEVKLYAYDERINWNTCIVIVKWPDGTVGPIGYTNGPV